MTTNPLARVASAGVLVNSGGMLISGEIVPMPAADADVTPGTPAFEAAVRDKREMIGTGVILAGVLAGGAAAFWALRNK